MIKNSTLTIFTFIIFLMVSGSILAQSNTPRPMDDRNELGQNSKPNSHNEAEMQNNPAAPNLNNPAMVKPSDPTGVNSNTPGSSSTPPSSVPGMDSGGSAPLTSPSGH